jgi:general secretion pathway protein G
VRPEEQFDKREGGWTFIETIIVIAIILILTSVVGVAVFRNIGRAGVAAARSQIDTLSSALNSYLVDNRRYPTQEQGLDALYTKPVLEPVPDDWDGPYLNKPVPDDPWGKPYEYIVPGPNGLPYGIRSLGADGMEGGEGDDADIVSWEN